jgi:hypothetical protein
MPFCASSLSERAAASARPDDNDHGSVIEIETSGSAHFRSGLFVGSQEMSSKPRLRYRPCSTDDPS